MTQKAQDDWVEMLLTGPSRARSADCTPGYYNNEGQDPGPAARYAVGYPHGPSAYFRYLDEWTRSGDFAGLEFR